MAFIQGQNEDENQNQQGNAPLVGQGSSQVGSAGVSQAGTGAGGGGAWTNIQAYLKANEGNTQSANALNKDVGSQFDQEKSGLESKASETKAQADAQNKAPSLDDAMYGGDAADAMKKYLNEAYGGPKTFDYGTGAKTQEYGDALGSRDGFQGLMQGLYNRSAGGAMTTGQRSLQQQLDVNNPALAQAQGDLSNRYKQLQSYAGQTAGDVNSYLQNAEKSHQTGQQDMRSQIGTRAADAKSQWDALEAQRGTWNEAKRGSLDEAIAPYKQQYAALQSFLGGGSTNPFDTTGEKDAGNATNADKYVGGDNMANMGETVAPWTDQFATVKKRRGILDDLSGATGWVAPATTYAKG